MNTFSMYSPRLDTTVATRPDQPSQGLNRMIAAAVVNQNFRTTLLNSPEEALQNGYYGQEFNLDSHERAMVLSIKAETLSDFATQIVEHDHEEYRYEQVNGSGRWVPAEPAMVVLDSN